MVLLANGGPVRGDLLDYPRAVEVVAEATLGLASRVEHLVEDPRMTWDPIADGRPAVHVHAEVPTDDVVRGFYELPQGLVDRVREYAPDESLAAAVAMLLDSAEEARERARDE